MRNSEEKIRQQTRLLIEAYAELTGREIIPGLEDFLQLRKRAEEEVRLGLSDGDDGKSCYNEYSGVMPVQVPDAPRVVPEMASTVKPSEAWRHDSSPVQDTDTPEHKTDAQSYIPDDEPEEEDVEISDFEILRRIRDEWN